MYDPSLQQLFCQIEMKIHDLSTEMMQLMLLSIHHVNMESTPDKPGSVASREPNATIDTLKSQDGLNFAYQHRTCSVKVITIRTKVIT